jgi:hypothetical protein
LNAPKKRDSEKIQILAKKELLRGEKNYNYYCPRDNLIFFGGHSDDAG